MSGNNFVYKNGGPILALNPSTPSSLCSDCWCSSSAFSPDGLSHPAPSAIRVTFSGIANRTDFPTPPCTACANWNGTYELPYFCAGGGGENCVYLLQVPPQCGGIVAVVTLTLILDPGTGYHWIAQITEGAYQVPGCWGLDDDDGITGGSRLSDVPVTDAMCNFGSDNATSFGNGSCTAPTAISITTIP